MSASDITTTKVLDPVTRREALQVIREVYQEEKRWVEDVDAEIPESIALQDRVSWFMVRVGGAPAGVIRLTYDFPLELPAELDVSLERSFDEAAVRRMRLVEVGRFMVLPRFRRRIRVVLLMIRAAVREVVERGYTHFITDVFDGDPHSPLTFHTNVLGFERIGTHRFGELQCSHTRIILLLDLVRAYERFRRRPHWVYREFTEGLHDAFLALKGEAPA